MAQEIIPKYDIFIVNHTGSVEDISMAFEQFNAKISARIEDGWQTDGNHRITFLHGYSKLVMSQQLKRYSKAYERYQGYSDARYVVMD